MKKSLKLNLRPICRDITDAGEKIGCFLKSHGLSDDSVQAQINILTGLIRNGIKYARFRPSADEIIVRIEIDEQQCTIEVLNPVDQTCSDQLKMLDKTIQFIRGYQDPKEAYSIRMAEAARQPDAEANDPDLVKIACEGGAILDFFVGEDNFLNLSAVGSFNRGGAIQRS